MASQACAATLAPELRMCRDHVSQSDLSTYLLFACTFILRLSSPLKTLIASRITWNTRQSGRRSKCLKMLAGTTTKPSMQNATVGADVREEVNKTTLGLYSFHVLVDCAYSAKYIEKGQLPAGPRPVLSFGLGAPKKKRIRIDKQENVLDLTQGIRTHSGRKYTDWLHARKKNWWCSVGRVRSMCQTRHKRSLSQRPVHTTPYFISNSDHGGSYISLYGILIGRTPKEKLVVLRGPGSERVPNTPQMQLKPVPCAPAHYFISNLGMESPGMRRCGGSVSSARSGLGANVSQLKIAMQSRGCAIECNGGVVCIIVAVAILLVYIEEPVAVSVYLVSADFPWALHL
ncbi:hypothetical protein B0H17DRAFT_1133201 [Mycena rosella]|uniref:Uncharacterized protein n=1 Tax=Mycena rosella TaxID=1033263 RepID=A0AAD7DKS0_MYCRO|nr:hypothetical protein B0H17DRAFT_1133201 [Mycena rosella]